MEKKHKKQHIGSHSNHSYPAKKGLPVEETRRYKEKPLFVDGELVIEGGKVKQVKRKMKTGLKDVKKFINKKRRGFLKQDTKKQIDESN